VEQLRIAHVLQLLQRLIRRLKETLREKVPCRGFHPDFLFVIPGDNDLLHSVFPLRLMHDADYTPFTHHAPCGESDTVVERREGKNIPVVVQRLCHTAALGLLPVLITQHERYRYDGWDACLGKKPIFYQQYWLRKKQAFFVTVPFSHNILHSNFIEECRAMRYI
jgi:hypothetical protein